MLANSFQRLMCVCGLTLCASVSAFAATDGNLGNNSTGQAQITVTVPKLIRARSFSDFTTALWSGSGDINQNDDLNISKNYTGTYRVTPSGSGAGGAFTITNGTQTVSYAAFFNDVTGITGRVSISNGVALTAQSGSATTLAATTLNANLSIQVLETNLQTVSAGTYTGILTLVFAPE